MPVECRTVSSSQFCELLGLDPARFRGVRQDYHGTIRLYVEPEAGMQTTGTFPQLTTKSKGGKKGGGKRGC